MAEQPNLGSFSAGDPQAQEAVQAAIAARQQGTAPVPQGQPVSPEPQGPTATPSPGGATAPTKRVPQSEAEMIVLGLSDRLKAIGATEKAAVSPELPSPQAAPVGGGSNVR